MAQQTINVGASPNDGTGTPLRTAFQYTNSNFSELYTAVGPSGNNIVVPGSATITGDLTVDTNTLKVDSANNRVGIGTASPAYLLDIADASFATRFVATNTNNSAFGAGVYLKTLNGASMVSNATLATSNDGTFNLLTGTSADSTKLSIGPTGIFTFQNVGGVAGTAMTLNSTGLGIGVSPSNNLHVQGASGATAIRISAVTDGTLGFIGSASGLISGSPANNLAVRAENGLYLSGGGNATQFILNSSGNVGIGGSPLDKFTVVGPSFLRGAAAGVRIGDGGGHGFVSAYDQTLSTAKDLVLQTGGGNVGIGVTPAGTGGCLQLKSGITFPATQVASSDANTLDDYEEGVWSPAVSGEVNLTSTTLVSARYTKIGRLVTVSGSVTTFIITSNTLAYFALQNLPFAAAAIGTAGSLWNDTRNTSGSTSVNGSVFYGFLPAASGTTSGSMMTLNFSISYTV